MNKKKMNPPTHCKKMTYVAVEMQTVDMITILFYAKHTNSWLAPPL